VATDNEEAEIIVGENVPFVTSIGTDTSNINNTFNQIERQDVGITLRITPQISTGDFVNLTIFVEISNVVQGTRNDPNGPTTTIRTTDTAVEVKSGQMVVTGGLISDSVTDATRGIPFLMDIPVLGNLFRRDDTNVRRTNLLIFITPHILKNQFDSRDQTKEANEKLTAEIDTYNIVPNRHEVLKNEKIDNVVEQIQPPDVLPSTITAPQKVSSELGRQATSADIMGDSLLIDTRPKAKSNKEKAARSTSMKSKKDAVISLTASPKLPAATPTKAEVVSTEIAPESTPPIPTEPVAIVPQQRTYIVLRDITGTALPSDSVLRYADSTGTVGYILGGPSDSTGAEFFSIGQRYKYKEGEVLRNFVCLGKYSSLSEVKAIHTELGADSTWNVLSPKDMLSLGKSPWTID
jgi:hypothetical protein